jgi:hypothetical protein
VDTYIYYIKIHGTMNLKFTCLILWQHNGMDKTNIINKVSVHFSGLCCHVSRRFTRRWKAHSQLYNYDREQVNARNPWQLSTLQRVSGVFMFKQYRVSRSRSNRSFAVSNDLQDTWPYGSSD